jgi:hypothetical protein
MAIVTGPLYSVSASGKIANSMVFFGWKGLSVVRQWIIPANPQSAVQGDQRIMLGGTGRAVGKIQSGFQFAQQLIDLDLIPSGQTKQSFLVKFILDNYIFDATSFGVQQAALVAHSAYAGWQTAADGLTLLAFDLPYAAIAPYNKALGLYLIAKAAIANGFVGSPYTTALASWDATKINEMVGDFTT